MKPTYLSVGLFGPVDSNHGGGRRPTDPII